MSTKDGKVIYLGRGGRVFGPYPAEKLDELRLSGELSSYTYLWEDGATQWKNIDPMPPTPGSAPRKRGGEGSLEAADAICHDHNALVAGKLENITDLGCELVSHDHNDAPPLGVNSPLVLNVMSAKGEKSANVKASVFEITRRAGAWIYHLRWAHRPTL